MSSTAKTIKRQGFSGRFVHWTVAVSTVLLVVSGLGQMPLFKRYLVDQLPLLGWTSDFTATLLLHYVAAMALTFAVAYHIAVHAARREFAIVPRRGDVKESIQIIKAMLGRGKEPESEKYLAEQRLAYAFIGGSLLLVLATGYLKVIKNLAGVSMGAGTMWVVTSLHNLAMVLVLLGVAGHLAAFLFKANRSLLPGMFTGRVDLEYARERHCEWCRNLGVDE